MKSIRKTTLKYTLVVASMAIVALAVLLFGGLVPSRAAAAFTGQSPYTSADALDRYLYDSGFAYTVSPKITVLTHGAGGNASHIPYFIMIIKERISNVADKKSD